MSALGTATLGDRHSLDAPPSGHAAPGRFGSVQPTDGAFTTNQGCAAQAARDRLGATVGWLSAAAVTVLVAAGVLALLVAEYAALWAVLVAPWLGTVGPIPRW